MQKDLVEPFQAGTTDPVTEAGRQFDNLIKTESALSGQDLQQVKDDFLNFMERYPNDYALLSGRGNVAKAFFPLRVVRFQEFMQERQKARPPMVMHYSA